MKDLKSFLKGHRQAITGTKPVLLKRAQQSQKPEMQWHKNEEKAESFCVPKFIGPKPVPVGVESAKDELYYYYYYYYYYYEYAKD